MVGHVPAELEAVRAVHPTYGVIQNNRVVNVLRVGVFTQAGIGTADKFHPRERRSGSVGQANGRSPIWIFSNRLRLRVVVRAVASERQFVDHRRREGPVPAEPQELPEVVAYGAAVVARRGHVQGVPLVAILSRAPEAPDLLLGSEVLVDAN